MKCSKLRGRSLKSFRKVPTRFCSVLYLTVRVEVGDQQRE